MLAIRLTILFVVVVLQGCGLLCPTPVYLSSSEQVVVREREVRVQGYSSAGGALPEMNTPAGLVQFTHIVEGDTILRVSYDTVLQVFNYTIDCPDVLYVSSDTVRSTTVEISRKGTIELLMENIIGFLFLVFVITLVVRAIWRKK